MSTAVRLAGVDPRDPVTHGIIDTDIHLNPAGLAALDPYLPKRWQEHQETYGLFTHVSENYPRSQPGACRTDASPPSGAMPGTDLEFAIRDHLDRWSIAAGVLAPLRHPSEVRNLDHASALCRATNDWQIHHCVERDERLHASIYVAPDDTLAAVAEIEARASDPRFVQVLVMVGTNAPAGHRQYWPIYEAAAHHGLPVGLHFGQLNGWPTSAAGNASFYLEDHVASSMMFSDQVVSLVFEGVFERFPTLRCVLIEGGFAWLLPLMWRMDYAFERLASEVPHVKRRPSEYVREHFWMTTQPMEEPDRPDQLMTMLRRLDMDEHIMFSSDYPHWDFDAPDRALPFAIKGELREKIMSGNARALYRLGEAGR